MLDQLEKELPVVCGRRRKRHTESVLHIQIGFGTRFRLVVLASFDLHNGEITTNSISTELLEKCLIIIITVRGSWKRQRGDARTWRSAKFANSSRYPAIPNEFWSVAFGVYEAVL
jgi:hypothetical protein